MEEILFDSYREYQKSHKDNILKSLFKLPIWAIVLLIMSIACLVLNVLIIIFGWVPIWGLVCLVAELLVFIILCFFTDNYRISSSDLRMKTYLKYCSELLVWLQSTGFSVTKTNIEIIIERVNGRIEAMQKTKQANHQRFDKWCQALLFPIVLAVFSAVIRSQTDIMVILAYAITLLITIGLVYLGLCNCINMLSFFEKRRIEQMRRFVEDLQGIIDTQLANRLMFIILRNETESLATRNTI